MPDYILDIPDDVLRESVEYGRPLAMIRTPDDYTGELDMHIRTPASGRVYAPVDLSINIAEGFENIMVAMATGGMRSKNDLIHLEKLYERAGMETTSWARSYMIASWKDLRPLAPPPTGVLPEQKISLSRTDFSALFTRPAVTGFVCRGTFNYRAAPLRVVEYDAERTTTGWEARTEVIENGIWHGPLRKLPAAFAIAAGFKSSAEAVEMTRNKHFLRGKTFDYDSPATALLFVTPDSKNITFRPANDSILELNAARFKSGRLEQKLQL
jgi:hypothetical protein